MVPKDNNVRNLIEQLIANKATEYDIEEFKRLLVSEEYDTHLQSEILRSFYLDKDLEPYDHNRKEQICKSILQNTSKSQSKVVKHKFRIVRIAITAAACALLVVLPYLHKQNYTVLQPNIFTHTDVEIKRDSTVTLSTTTIEPAIDYALLKLSNGDMINLHKLKIGSERVDQNIRLRKESDGVVLFEFVPEHNKSIRRGENTIVTPRGATFRIKLTDGTLVSLNAQSALSFPSDFGSEERKVSLIGEGYFEVAKDNGKKFIVTLPEKGNDQVIVYGTTFNVSAYRTDPNWNAVLIEGKVKVSAQSKTQERLLAPMQKATVSENIAILKADPYYDIAWKNNIFYFSNKPILSVLHEIARWYDVDIKMKEIYPNTEVWGVIDRTKDLRKILDDLETMSDLKFTIQGREVQVTK